MTDGDKTRRLKPRRHATLPSALAVLAFGAIAIWPLYAAAQVNVDIVIGTPPPPVRVEVVPAPRPGYIWAPGYWSWERHRHVWHEGYWEIERPGQHFVPTRWVDTPGGWRFVPAHWEHPEHGFCPPGQAKKGRC